MLTAEQLQFRSTGLGGSDISAVLGLNPWKSPVDLFLEKTGQVEDAVDPDAPPIYWGNVLEDVVAREYARRKGVKVRRDNRSLRHPEHECLVAHLDRRIVGVGERKILECKTAGERMADRWGPDGTDQVPDYYLVQVIHYMAVDDAPVADTAVLIGGRDFRTYSVRRDPVLEAEVVERSVAFWHDHVLAGVPPEPRSGADVLALYPSDDGIPMEASPQMLDTYHTLVGVRGQLKPLVEEEKALKEALQIAMGPAEALVDGQGKKLVTWRASKPTQALDAKALAADHPILAADYTRNVPGQRKFLVK